MTINTELTAKNKAIFITTALILFTMGLGLYIAMKIYCSQEVIDNLNNIAIVLLLIFSLGTRIYPSENVAYNLDILTIVFTTIISANLIDFKKSEGFSYVMTILTIVLPFIFSYIFINVLINKQKSDMINFMNTYRKGGLKPDYSSAEYRRLHSAYNIMSGYIVSIDDTIKNYKGDDNFTVLNIENSKDEDKLKDRYNVLLRYYLEKGYRVELTPGDSGVSKIKISW